MQVFHHFSIQVENDVLGDVVATVADTFDTPDGRMQIEAVQDCVRVLFHVGGQPVYIFGVEPVHDGVFGEYLSCHVAVFVRECRFAEFEHADHLVEHFADLY